MRNAAALALLLAAACGGRGCGLPAGGGAGDAGAPDAGAPTSLEFRYTEHLGRLTGTTLNPLVPIGMTGTDLGVSFARDGQLAFLFGDAWMDNEDSIATTPLAPVPGRFAMPKLAWEALPSSPHFVPFVVPGVDLGAMNVPMEAVPDGARTYYFFTTGWSSTTSTYTSSVLAHGTGLDIGALTLDHDVPSAKFINVSVVVDAKGVAWIFGSGPYRKSPVYLAQVELDHLADRSAWRYWPGFAAGAGEAAAQPLVGEACVGELSVRRQPQTGLWLMAYNCDTPRGVHLRTATGPTGPWSDPPLLVYAPSMGYEEFIHANESVVGHDDGLADTGREDEWGGEYGPYLVPAWFEEPSPGVYSIVYTLSSWNPYAVHLMRTVLAAPGVHAAAPDYGAGLPKAALVNGDFATGDTSGWSASGDPFAVFKDANGFEHLTTYGAAGDATMGQLWQDFTVDDATSQLHFYVDGGDARVELHLGDEVVRRSHGRETNSVETEVTWSLADLRGQTVRLVVVDDLTSAWGFVGARSFELR